MSKKTSRDQENVLKKFSTRDIFIKTCPINVQKHKFNVQEYIYKVFEYKYKQKYYGYGVGKGLFEWLLGEKLRGEKRKEGKEKGKDCIKNRIKLLFLGYKVFKKKPRPPLYSCQDLEGNYLFLPLWLQYTFRSPLCTRFKV